MSADWSFEEFQAVLAELLQVDPARLQPEAYFITDLGVDSLRMVEILLALEEWGLQLSPDDVWEIQTIADAYEKVRGETSSHSYCGAARSVR